MKICVTTSDKYLHIIPVFCYLYNRYWGEPFELVGYTKPDNLPDNCTFHSMGKQGTVNQFSDDLIKYFKGQYDNFIWLMEDTFLRQQVNFPMLRYIESLMVSNPHFGRFSLSPDSIRHYTSSFRVEVMRLTVYQTPPDSDYRLSTQPAIWNKNYLLKWLEPDHTPWQFENLKGTLMQRPDEHFANLALDKFSAPVMHNEGVRKRDLYHYDLSGMSDVDVEHIKALS